MATRILLADNHTIFRDAVRALIERRDDLGVVGEAEDGPQALALIQDLEPDVVLIEAALPRLSGIEVARRMSLAGSPSRFLMLSGQEGVSGLQKALAAGAAGFLYKTDPSDQLLQAIDALMAGRRYVSPAVAQHLAGIVAGAEDVVEGCARHLTNREREVLQLVVEGLSSKEVASSLGISTRTVESHRAKLMEKLDIHKVSGLVRYAIREGIVNA